MEAARAATSKQQLLAMIETERANWDALLNEIGEDRMTLPGAAGEWTFKDVAAHLNDWRTRTLDRLDAVARGDETPPPPWPVGMDEETDEGVDQINNWFYERSKDRPLVDILAQSREQYQRLHNATAAVSEPDLLEPGRLDSHFPWLEGNALGPVILGSSFGHLHEEHEPAIRAWLAGLDVGR